MQGYVVFDNNAYKGISGERLQRIIAAERACGIVPLANIVVLQELLARARAVDLGLRRQNRAAIWKLGLHCAVRHGGRTDVNFLGHIESQVYRLITGATDPDDANIFDTFSDLIRVVTAAQNDDLLAEIADALEVVEKVVAKVEAEYLIRLRATVTTGAQPDQMKRNLDYAAGLVMRTQQLYGRRFQPEEIVVRIIDIAKLSSIAFALNDSVVTEIRQNGGGHARHANTVWDEEVVSSTSMYTTIAGKSVLLVTEEKRLIAAAASADADDRVCSISAYERLLELPVWGPAAIASEARRGVAPET